MYLDVNRPIYLVGGGGHCKVLFDCLILMGGKISGYCDFSPIEWLDNLLIPRISEEKLKELCEKKSQLAMCFVGRNPDDLKERCHQIELYKSYGAFFPTIIHPQAILSPHAKIKLGTQILAGAIINSFASLEENAIINTRVVVEHDAYVGNGVHIAPGAILLGGTNVGRYSYIGATSLLIQNTSVPEHSFIKAGTIWNGNL